MSEPTLVVESREHLWYLLTEAAQLEHMIMCQYLYATFSLKTGVDEGLDEAQAAAVSRWRTSLRGIAVDEMLHLALVANVMAALGAAPTLGRPSFPQRSGYFPPTVQLDLLPFDEASLTHFLYLERPEAMERMDADGFVPMTPPHEPLTPRSCSPGCRTSPLSATSTEALPAGWPISSIDSASGRCSSARRALRPAPTS